MVSTLGSTNLDTPVTPACNTSINTPSVERAISQYTTPEGDGENIEAEPRTPQKESSIKKKSSRIGSKRKLFLQSGPGGGQNKVKKVSSLPTAKPKKVATPVPTSPTTKTSNGSAGKEGAWPTYPLTERQQLQYLLEVTAKEAQKEPQDSDSNQNQAQMFTRLKKKDAIKREANALRMSKRNERGETLLHLAAIKGDTDETIALIKGGVSVNAEDYAGWTPLHEACNFGHLNIVDELLKAGANVNVPGYEEISPLHDAVINNHVQVVELLLRYGANPEQTTMQGYTAKDLARSTSILELLHSAQPSSTNIMAPPLTDSSPVNAEKTRDFSDTPNQVNASPKESTKLSPEKGYISDSSQPISIQASPQKYTFIRSSNLEQNYLYSRRSSSSSTSQISDVDDSIESDPKRLNECLDKAMLEMSSYLDPKESTNEFLNQGFPKSNPSVVNSTCAATIATTRSKTLDDKRLCDQQNLGNKQNSMSNGQSNSNKGEKDVLKTSVPQENEAMKQMTSKSQILEDGSSNKENHPSQIMVLQSDNMSNILNQNLSNNKVDNIRNSGDVDKAVQDCFDHIKNPTWRKALEKHYYSASSLPLYVPGYKKFMMSTKSYGLHTQDTLDSSPSSKTENVEEDELTRLKTAHQVEREKLQLCLEQEIVRLFGSFARRAIEKDVPFGACTILKQQMKTHGREEPKPKKNEDKLSGQSIKAEVEQLIQKFEKLKTKLLNRQRHEIDAIIALQQLAQGKTGGKSSETTQQQTELKYKDFELMPEGFREYYEEFLGLID